MNRFLKKIDYMKEKMLLIKIKKIIVNEFNNNYYDNAANIQEIVDLGTQRISSETFKTTDHVKNMFIYQNGFVIFNDFIRKVHFMPTCGSEFTRYCKTKNKDKKFNERLHK